MTREDNDLSMVNICLASLRMRPLLSSQDVDMGSSKSTSGADRQGVLHLFKWYNHLRQY